MGQSITSRVIWEPWPSSMKRTAWAGGIEAIKYLRVISNSYCRKIWISCVMKMSHNACCLITLVHVYMYKRILLLTLKNETPWLLCRLLTRIIYCIKTVIFKGQQASELQLLELWLQDSLPMHCSSCSQLAIVDLNSAAVCWWVLICCLSLRNCCHTSTA